MSRRKPPQTYNVIVEADGALVVIGVDLATARAEQARLNAEAKGVVAQRPALTDAHGQTVQPARTEHAGMHMGNVTRHAIQSTEGLLIP